MFKFDVLHEKKIKILEALISNVENRFVHHFGKKKAEKKRQASNSFPFYHVRFVACLQVHFWPRSTGGFNIICCFICKLVVLGTQRAAGEIMEMTTEGNP